MTTKELGNLGEKLACEYLVEKGFNILGKNWRISLGELDIIAKKRWKLLGAEKTIHFVEVKASIGNGRDYFPQDRVNYGKQKKLRQLCQIWLKQHKFPQNHPCQIDIIAVVVNSISDEFYIHFFENAVADV